MYLLGTCETYIHTYNQLDNILNLESNFINKFGTLYPNGLYEVRPMCKSIFLNKCTQFYSKIPLSVRIPQVTGQNMAHTGFLKI